MALTEDELKDMLADACDLLQEARAVGLDPGNTRTWAQTRKALVNECIDAGIWPKKGS